MWAGCFVNGFSDDLAVVYFEFGHGSGKVDVARLDPHLWILMQPGSKAFEVNGSLVCRSEC